MPGNICCVSTCPNSYDNQSSVRSKDTIFHSFPIHNKLNKLWWSKLKSGKLGSRSVKCHAPQGSKVCSDHFRIKSYKNNEKKKRNLLTGAIPELNLPQNHLESRVDNPYQRPL